MSLKTVFIDAGGTLIEENPPRAEIYSSIARAHGLPVAPPEMARLMRLAHDALPLVIGGAYRYSDGWFEAFMERIFHRELGLERAALPGIARELFERFSDPATFRVFPGARELLDELAHMGLRAAVVSNWSGRLPALLTDLGLAEGLAAVVVSAEERCEKPDPEIFRRALARTGTAPEDALHAGDHPTRDVAGARAAGIEAVLVDHRGLRERGSARRVRSLFELGHLLRERAA